MRFTSFSTTAVLTVLASAVSAARFVKDTELRVCWKTSSAYNFEGCSEDKTPQCLCSNEHFIATVLACAENHLDKQIDNAKTLQALANYCNSVKVPLSQESLTKSIIYARSIEQREAEPHTVHTRAVQVSKESVSFEAEQYSIILDNRRRHKILAGALTSTWGLLLIYGILSHFCFNAARAVLTFFDGKFSRSLRKRWLLAPLGSKTHSRPFLVKGFPFQLPTRFISSFILFQFIANIVLLCVWYNIQPAFFPHPPGKNAPPAMNVVGDRAGVMALMQFPLLFLYGGRNNFLLWLTGWPLDTFNVLHKWSGRLVVFNIIIHSLCHFIAYLKEGVYGSYWSVAFFVFGNVAGFTLFINAAFSMHFFRSKRYELFLIVHILFAAAILVLVYKHVSEFGIFVNFPRAAIAVWGFDRVVRLLRIVWSGVKSKATMTYHPDNIVQIDLDYSERWKFYPGCFAFVHFAHADRFWQNHPFTLIHKPDDPKKLQMFIRVKDGMTKRLSERAQVDGGVHRSGVWIDGPYGSQHPVHKYDVIMFYAGGIGITGTYTYAQDLVGKTKDAEYHFVWVVSDLRALDWFRDHLVHLLQDERFTVQIWFNPLTKSSSASSADSEDDEAKLNLEKTRELDTSSNGDSLDLLTRYANFSLHDGIPNIRNDVNDTAVALGKRSLAVLSCGPGAMNDDVRCSVIGALDTAGGRVDYFEESFSW